MQESHGRAVAIHPLTTFSEGTSVARHSRARRVDRANRIAANPSERRDAFARRMASYGASVNDFVTGCDISERQTQNGVMLTFGRPKC
jgi:hypothetical protein